MLSFAPDQRTGLFVESMRAFKSFPLPIAAVTSVESPRCCSFLLGKRLNGLAWSPGPTEIGGIVPLTSVGPGFRPGCSPQDTLGGEASLLLSHLSSACSA